MKLWEKGVNPEPAIIEFTAGTDRQTDLVFAKWDIIGSMAHVIMLQLVGLISKDEKVKILQALHSLFELEEKGNLIIEDNVEDIHSQVEKEISAELGDIGKKIHTGRSRNDQVLVDIRLYTREQIDKLAMQIKELFTKLQEQSTTRTRLELPQVTEQHSR